MSSSPTPSVPDDPTDPTGGSGSPSVPPSPPSLSPDPDRTPTIIGKSGTIMTLTGVPTEGVESGCLLLSGHLLLGGPRDLLASGQRVRVTGRVEPNVMSTCQQGIPFVVDSAEPA
ncbi:MAG: hypothetical protein ACRDWI_12675 [Jiangellaceae bacterium]